MDIVGELGGSNLVKFMSFRSFFSQSAVLGGIGIIDRSSTIDDGGSFDLVGDRRDAPFCPVRPGRGVGSLDCVHGDLEGEERSPFCTEVLGELHDVAGISGRRVLTDRPSRYFGARKSVSWTTCSGTFIWQTLAGAPVPRVLFFFHGLTHPSLSGPRSDAERINSGLPCR